MRHALGAKVAVRRQVSLGIRMPVGSKFRLLLPDGLGLMTLPRAQLNAFDDRALTRYVESRVRSFLSVGPLAWTTGPTPDALGIG